MKTVLFLKYFQYTIVLLLLLFSISIEGQNLQISGGNNFSAALCDNQTVYAWGANTIGQVGLNSVLNPYPASNYTPPQQVYGLPPIKQVDAGSGAHAVVLDCANQ